MAIFVEMVWGWFSPGCSLTSKKINSKLNLSRSSDSSRVSMLASMWLSPEGDDLNSRALMRQDKLIDP